MRSCGNASLGASFRGPTLGGLARLGRLHPSCAKSPKRISPKLPRRVSASSGLSAFLDDSSPLRNRGLSGRFLHRFKRPGQASVISNQSFGEPTLSTGLPRFGN